MNPIGSLSFMWRSVTSLVVGILVAIAMPQSASSKHSVSASSKHPAPQTTTMRPGQRIIAGGNTHSLALKKDGTVWGWGDNAYGQLGIGNRDDHQIPYQVHGPGNVGFLTDIGAPAASNPPDDDTGKPEVMDMTPAPGATDVPRRTTVTATFSEQMDTSTLAEENFRLYEMSARKGPVRIRNVSVMPNPEGTKAPRLHSIPMGHRAGRFARTPATWPW